MTFAPLSIQSSGSILYSLEKAGKNLDGLLAFCAAKGYSVEVQGYNHWFSGQAVNEFLAA